MTKLAVLDPRFARGRRRGRTGTICLICTTSSKNLTCGVARADSPAAALPEVIVFRQLLGFNPRNMIIINPEQQLA